MKNECCSNIDGILNVFAGIWLMTVGMSVLSRVNGANLTNMWGFHNEKITLPPGLRHSLVCTSTPLTSPALLSLMLFISFSSLLFNSPLHNYICQLALPKVFLGISPHLLSPPSPVPILSRWMVTIGLLQSLYDLISHWWPRTTASL